MTATELDSIYIPSEDIVAREIDGELIIVPIGSGVGDTEDELYSLNETGRVIWALLDKEKSLNSICSELDSKFNASLETIQTDVIGLTTELLKRNIIQKVNV